MRIGRLVQCLRLAPLLLALLPLNAVSAQSWLRNKLPSDLRKALDRGELQAIRANGRVDSLRQASTAVQLAQSEIFFAPRPDADSSARPEVQRTPQDLPIIIGVTGAGGTEIIAYTPTIMGSALRYSPTDGMFSGTVRIAIKRDADAVDAGADPVVPLSIFADVDSIRPARVELRPRTATYGDVKVYVREPKDAVELTVHLAADVTTNSKALLPVATAGIFMTPPVTMEGWGTQASRVHVRVLGTSKLDGIPVQLSGDGEFSPAVDTTGPDGVASFVMRTNAMGFATIGGSVGGFALPTHRITVTNPTRFLGAAGIGVLIAMLVAFAAGDKSDRPKRMLLAAGMALVTLLAFVGLGINLLSLALPPFLTSFVAVIALSAIGGVAGEAGLRKLTG